MSFHVSNTSIDLVFKDFFCECVCINHVVGMKVDRFSMLHFFPDFYRMKKKNMTWNTWLLLWCLWRIRLSASTYGKVYDTVQTMHLCLKTTFLVNTINYGKIYPNKMELKLKWLKVFRDLMWSEILFYAHFKLQIS